MLQQSKKNQKLYLRNFVFGIEDALVSTVGLLSGIAVAGMPKKSILIAGVILIFVEAFSMGAGSFISEHSSEEYINKKHQTHNRHFFAALIMFASYFVAGFIPLLPYIIVEVGLAFWLSIIASLITLFSLGATNAKIFKIKIWGHALEMLAVGGIATLVGVSIGKLAKLFL